jgi:hypothetical protein
MARLPRYVIPGQPQHIIQRGNNRQAIFVSKLGSDTIYAPNTPPMNEFAALARVNRCNRQSLMQYDHHGNLEKKSAVAGLDGGAINDTLIYYNVRGQKLTLTDPDTGTTTYSYNGAGE